MIYNNVEITNCVEIERQEDDSIKLYRIPIELHNKIKGDGSIASGIEIRFVPIDSEVTITLKNDDFMNRVNRAVMFYGEFQGGWDVGQRDILPGITELKFEKANNIALLKNLAREHGHVYSPEVIRLRLDGMTTSIIDVKGNCRPPRADEVPDKKYLAYGSSITHGSEGQTPNNGYVMRTADNLGMELINLGMPGSARLEKEMADYIASRDDFEFATLEMGVNIFNIDYDDFRERTEYFVKTIATAHGDKKIFCIDSVVNDQDLWDDSNPEKHSVGFRNIVKEVAGKYPNTIYINGLDLLSDVCGLTADITHPSAQGMEMIAQNLTRIIKGEVL